MEAKRITIRELLQTFLLPSVLPKQVKLEAINQIHPKMVECVKLGVANKVCHNDTHFGNWMIDLTDKEMCVWKLLLQHPTTPLNRLSSNILKELCGGVLKNLNQYTQTPVEMVTSNIGRFIKLDSLQLIDFGDAFTMTQAIDCDDLFRLDNLFTGVIRQINGGASR